MKMLVFRSAGHGTLKLARWLICFLPLLSAGCFDSPSAYENSANKRELGIAALSRFFSFGRTAPAEIPQAAVSAEVIASATDAFAVYAQKADDFPGLSEEITAFQNLGFQGENLQIPENMFVEEEGSISPTGAAKPEGVMNSAGIMSLVLNGRFSQIFSSLFHPGRSDETAPGSRDDLPNPFTEAKQQITPSSSSGNSEGSPTAAGKTGSGTSNSNDASPTKPSDPAMPSGRFPALSAGGFLILGDFDGSGTLRAKPALRSNDTVFISEDGRREFSLFINAAAAEQKRAFYVDDMNGDGNPDFLVTSWMGLSGGVFLGDGLGGYQLADKFLTGYEPVIPCAGPYRNGKREIVTVNTTNGRLKTFYSDDRYRPSQAGDLGFVPDYLMHLAAQESSQEFLLAAQLKGMHQIWVWKENSRLEGSTEALPVEPLVYTGEFGSDSLRAYQVGPYASVVLTSRGWSFNIANFRMFPNIFLVIGDLKGRGQTDAAVGTLVSFIPAKSNF